MVFGVSGAATSMNVCQCRGCGVRSPRRISETPIRPHTTGEQKDDDRDLTRPASTGNT
jgi:hypothetical protein